MAIICCDLNDCIYNEDGFCSEDMIDLETGECITYTNEEEDQE